MMKAEVLAILVIVILTAVTDVSGSSGHTSMGACNCPAKHPQQKFCDDSLVIKGAVIGIGSEEATARDGGMNMDMLISMRVIEVFKTADRSIEADSVIQLHTYGMCHFDLMLKVGQEYVISATDAYQLGYYVILRGCSWVQKWNTVTREQREGLTRDYHNCGQCAITKTIIPYSMFDDYNSLMPSPLGEEDRPMGYCFHNQQMALTMRRYIDCETLYSACIPKLEGCGWTETREYKKCMKKRVKAGKKTKGGKKANGGKRDKGGNSKGKEKKGGKKG